MEVSFYQLFNKIGDRSVCSDIFIIDVEEEDGEEEEGDNEEELAEIIGL